MTPDRGVAIVDGGGANIASLQFALERLGYQGQLTTDPGVISTARRVILPGVGAAPSAMARLTAAGLDTLVRKLRQPVLGICLGLQLLFESSDEENADCMGILPGRARRFAPGPGRPVPHMGWNQVSKTRPGRLLDDVPDGSWFYFVHSYAVPPVTATVATADYGGPFSAVVEHGNFMATQFHPERSGAAGARVLANFLDKGFD